MRASFVGAMRRKGIRKEDAFLKSTTRRSIRQRLQVDTTSSTNATGFRLKSRSRQKEERRFHCFLKDFNVGNRQEATYKPIPPVANTTAFTITWRSRDKKPKGFPVLSKGELNVGRLSFPHARPSESTRNALPTFVSRPSF